MTHNSARLLIIGGGITGLAAAYRLRKVAPAVEITLVEGDSRLGGKLLTDRFDGFVIEGGADSFLTSKPRGVGLCRELGIEGALQGTRDETRRTYVMRNGTLYPMPEGLTGLVPSRLEPLLDSPLFSAEGKARLRREPDVSVRPPGADETLGHFVERRFGREVYERLIEPLMAGIYAGNGDELSLEATFPQLRRMELDYGSLICGLEAARSTATTTRPGFATPETGMQALIEALVSKLDGVRLLLGTRIQSLRRVANGFVAETNAGDVLRTDACVIATPASASAQVIESLAPEATGLLTEIPYVSTATVTLGYEAAALGELPMGHGYVIPRMEGRQALACTWVSQKFAHRAPSGFVVLRVFIGRAGGEDALSHTDRELVAIARGELATTLDIGAVPIFQRIFRWPAAMPQYTLGHLDRLTRIEAAIESVPGLYLAGALRGVGIPDCIASGEAAAERAATYLKQKSGSY